MQENIGLRKTLARMQLEAAEASQREITLKTELRLTRERVAELKTELEKLDARSTERAQNNFTTGFRDMGLGHREVQK